MPQDKINTIIATSKKEKWPYAKVFEAFKDAGIESYEVVLDDYEATYVGKQNSWKKPISVDLPPLKINEAFSADKVKELWHQHQKGDANYADFLQGAAKAGVKGYRVDIDARTVHCFGIDPTKQHREYVA